MLNEIIEIPPMVAHQYLIPGDQGYLLVDTGLPDNYTYLISFLKKKNISLDSIRLVIITHADADHFGSLSKLESDYPDMISSTSQMEADAIVLGQSSRELKHSNKLKELASHLLRPFLAVAPARIDHILSIGEILPYLGGLEVLDTSGHTPGHISLWSKATKTLFSGDSIRISRRLLSPSSGSNTWDEEKAQISFDRQLSLQPDHIYGGHGIWHR